MHSAGADRPRRAIVHLTSLLVLVAANVLIYREYWSVRKVFSGKDFLTGFHLLLNFQSDCLQEGSWPLWNPFMNFGFPYVEHYINSALFPTHLFMGLVSGSTVMIIQWEVLTWIIIGGFGIYLCVREFGLSPLTGIIAGASFMACGQIIALPQWNTLVYNAACFPYLILGYHHAKVRGRAFNPTSIAFLTFSIYGGYTVTTVLGIYLFIGYVAIDAVHSRRTSFAFKYLATTLLAALSLSLPKLLPLYAGISAGPRLASAAPPPGALLDTFNIISPYNFWSLLLPVKFYFSLFIGSLGILALTSGLLKREIRFSPLLAMTVLSGWLLVSGNDGSPSLLRSLSNFLPFMRLVRNDWLSWFYPSLFAILFLARPIEAFLLNRSLRDRATAAGIHIALLSLGFFLAFNTRIYFLAYGTHVAFVAAWAFIGIAPSRGSLRSVLAFTLVAVELVLVFSRVNVDSPPLQEGNRVLYSVIDQGSVSRSYRESNQVRSRFSAIAAQDHLRPGIDDARKHPVLISGLDGAPTYNLYPEQYGRFIDYMNLKQFSGWWYNTQERFEFIQLKDSPVLAALEGQPLVVLFDLNSAAPLQGGVSFDKLTCSSFSFTVRSNKPSFLLLRQMYDDRWTVQVDSAQSKPMHAEDFFMGVPVEPGTHAVKFIFRDPLFSASIWISGLTLAGLFFAGIILRSRKRRRPGIDSRPITP